MAVLTCNYYSRARVGMQSFTAILPMDPPPTGPDSVVYANGPWPTIYLLHGFSGSRNDWLLHTDIEALAAQYGYAVIMPDGANRFYLDQPEMGELYGAYVGRELVDATRRMFNLSHKREDTVIGGLSMGGFGAIRNGMYYADTFGAIIALSSALITDEIAAMTPETGGNFMASYGYYRHTFGEPSALLGSDRDPKRLASQCVQKGNVPRLFLACGEGDFLYAPNVDYHETLVKMNYAHEWWVRPGAHDYPFWNQSLPAAMVWLEAQK